MLNSLLHTLIHRLKLGLRRKARISFQRETICDGFALHLCYFSSS